MHRPIRVALWLLYSSLVGAAASAAPAKPPARSPAAAEPAASAAPQVPQTVPAALLQNGLWDVNVVREIPGTPTRRTVASQECFNDRPLPGVLPRSTEDGMSCQYLDPTLKGEVVSWTVQCSGKSGTVRGPASITLAGTSYKGSATLEHKAGAKLTKMNETFEGKRVGDCR